MVFAVQNAGALRTSALVAAAVAVYWVYHFAPNELGRRVPVPLLQQAQLLAEGVTECAAAAVDFSNGGWIYLACTRALVGVSVVKLWPDGTYNTRYDWGSAEAGETLYSLAVDTGGAVYACGTTEGSVDGQQPLGGQDAFWTKFDASGNRSFTVQYGGAGDDACTAIGVNPLAPGLVFTTGAGQAGIYAYAKPQGVSGASAYLLAFDTTAGTPVWGARFAASEGEALAFDTASSDVIVVGTGFEVVNNYGFLARYSQRGAQLALQTGAYGGAPHYFTSVVFDRGLLHVGGATGAGVFDGTACLAACALVATFDATTLAKVVNATVVWGNPSTNIQVSALAMDPCTNALYALGYTDTSFPGGAPNAATNAATTDVFLSTLDMSAYAVTLNEQFGTVLYDNGYALAVTARSQLVLAGSWDSAQGFYCLANSLILESCTALPYVPSYTAATAATATAAATTALPAGATSTVTGTGTGTNNVPTITLIGGWTISGFHLTYSGAAAAATTRNVLLAGAAAVVLAVVALI